MAGPQVPPLLLGPDDLLLVTAAREGDAIVLHGAGEIDLHTAPVLVEHARRALGEGVRQLCIDLREIDHLDSSGIAALVNIRRYVLRADGALVLVCAGPRVLQLLQVADLARHFTIVSTLDEALLTLA